MMPENMNRRNFLGAIAATGSALHPSIARALAIPAHKATGTIRDVEHIVVLTQENRAFNHYFGTLNGVRGFGDRFPVPVARTAEGVRSLWLQPNADRGSGPDYITPFRLNTAQTFDYMRVEGTPHGFADTQDAWDQGRMKSWPISKHNHSMGYYTEEDIPFQFALANAFTLCDSYFCSMLCSTNPNRLFIWTGTNDPLGRGHGPVTNNDYDTLYADPANHGGYTWKTYPERLQEAGVSWQVYQDMDDNYTDNPLEGFRVFRDAMKARGGPAAELARRGIWSRKLEQFKQDAMDNALPQVSWIVAPGASCEHPGASSPAQGADYTSRVLDALTANPDIWSKTVLLINFDENDGFFDHVPPPAVPARASGRGAAYIGGSNISTEGEYHEVEGAYRNRPYGLGPRVPLYVISPWSRGGYVNSQLFDHTSILRFIEARFGVAEPNISPWRRTVCGDLSTCFDFKTPDATRPPMLPSVEAAACRASRLDHRRPPTPATNEVPAQKRGVRPARALPYRLAVDVVARHDGVDVHFANDSADKVGVVFHVYDRLDLDAIPRRYSLAAGTRMTDGWASHDGHYDLWIMGPDGFHRHFFGNGGTPLLVKMSQNGKLTFGNLGHESHEISIIDKSYGKPDLSLKIVGGKTALLHDEVMHDHGWYDISIVAHAMDWRFAGHIQSGRDTHSDPAMFGTAHLLI